MRILFIHLLSLLLLTVSINAKGVLAGTQIENSVELTYEIGGMSHTQNSNTVIDTVDQLIDLKIVSNDPTHIFTANGQNDQILTFKLTNTGNGKDTFALTNDANATNNFTVTNPRIFVDTNNNGIYDPSIDTQASEVTLDADAFTTLFFLGNIPNANLPTNDTSSNGIIATSKTGGSGTAGTIYPNKGIDGIFAVDGVKGGVDRAYGVYEIVNIAPKLTESASLSSSEIYTGTIITYTIKVNILGVGTLQNLIINDPIPPKTTYVTSSLKLDGVSLSDSNDSDSGSFGSNAISVNLGNATQTTQGEYEKTITFQVKVN